MEYLFGRLVISKAGHDKNKIYVIIDCDNEYVYLSDGNVRKLDNLKKKRKKHVQPINYLSEELINKNKSSKIIDEDVKRAIKLFVNR